MPLTAKNPNRALESKAQPRPLIDVLDSIEGLATVSVDALLNAETKRCQNAKVENQVAVAERGAPADQLVAVAGPVATA